MSERVEGVAAGQQPGGGAAAPSRESELAFWRARDVELVVREAAASRAFAEVIAEQNAEGLSRGLLVRRRRAWALVRQLDAERGQLERAIVRAGFEDEFWDRDYRGATALIRED